MTTKPDLSGHIEKVLDMSTCHVTASDNGLLHNFAGDDEKLPVRILEYRYGYMVSAWHHYNEREPGEIKTFEKEVLALGFSKHFLRLIKVAAKADCRWLQLDRDGETVTGLPVFEW